MEGPFVFSCGVLPIRFLTSGGFMPDADLLKAPMSSLNLEQSDAIETILDWAPGLVLVE